MQRQLSVCWLTVELGPGHWAPPCPTNPGLTQSKRPVQRAHGTGPDLGYLLRPPWAGWGWPGCGHSRDWTGGTISGETPTQSPLTLQGPGLATGRAELGSDQRPQHSALTLCLLSASQLPFSLHKSVLPLLCRDFAGGSPWLQTLNYHSLLILNKSIFAGEISDLKYLF